MKRKLSGQHNQCAACLEYFNSNVAFEKHRIGDFGIDRRCATIKEMYDKGMAKNAGDWWVTALNLNPYPNPADFGVFEEGVGTLPSDCEKTPKNDVSEGL
jgi:hypothetical protein